MPGTSTSIDRVSLRWNHLTRTPGGTLVCTAPSAVLLLVAAHT